jgi:hypothetical protein
MCRRQSLLQPSRRFFSDALPAEVPEIGNITGEHRSSHAKASYDGVIFASPRFEPTCCPPREHYL